MFITTLLVRPFSTFILPVLYYLVLTCHTCWDVSNVTNSTITGITTRIFKFVRSVIIFTTAAMIARHLRIVSTTRDLIFRSLKIAVNGRPKRAFNVTKPFKVCHIPRHGGFSRFLCYVHHLIPYAQIAKRVNTPSVGCQTAFDTKSISCQTVTTLHVLDNSKTVSNKSKSTAVTKIPVQKLVRQLIQLENINPLHRSDSLVHRRR